MSSGQPMQQGECPEKVALVTGGSRGIGRATALALARAGFAVVINYRSRAGEANSVVDEIRRAGGQALALQADVADSAQVAKMYAAISKNWGPVSVLVNNAGVLERQMPFAVQDQERWRRVFDANVFGVFHCCHALLQTWQSGTLVPEGAAIINVSSGAARSGSPNEYVDYAASKGALDSFTIGLAKELAPQGVRVNGVRPGFIDTEIHADGGEPGRVQRLAPNIPLRRGGTADEVAEAIVWLATSATYSSGAFIDVTGGV